MNIKKEIEEMVGEEHDFQTNDVGGSFCSKCGQILTTPVWPLKCSNKKVVKKWLNLFKKYAHQHCERVLGKDDKISSTMGKDFKLISLSRNLCKKQLRQKNNKLLKSK